MKRELNEVDKVLLKKVGGAPRILGYRNLLDFVNLRRWNKKIVMVLSVNPLDGRGRVFTFGDFGITEARRCNRHHVEQFQIELDQTQARELLKALQNKLTEDRSHVKE